MRLISFLAAPLLLTACSSSGDASSCGVAAGTYAQTEILDPGNPGSCGPDGVSRPTTFTVSDHGDGTAEIVIERRTDACPATLDGCTLTAQCPWKETGGGAIGDVQLSLTFSASGATGTSTYTLDLPDGGPVPRCSGNFLVSATRQ